MNRDRSCRLLCGVCSSCPSPSTIPRALGASPFKLKTLEGAERSWRQVLGRRPWSLLSHLHTATPPSEIQKLHDAYGSDSVRRDQCRPGGGTIDRRLLTKNRHRAGSRRRPIHRDRVQGGHDAHALSPRRTRQGPLEEGGLRIRRREGSGEGDSGRARAIRRGGGILAPCVPLSSTTTDVCPFAIARNPTRPVNA